MLPGQTEKIEVAKAEKMHQQTNFSDQNFCASLFNPSFGKRSFCASGIKGSLFSLIFGVKNCSKPFLDTGLNNFNALYSKIHEKLIKSYEILNLKHIR